MADLADRSYLEDGVWYDIEHKPYRDQQRATDVSFRTFVDDLIRDMTVGHCMTGSGSGTVRHSEILVVHRPASASASPDDQEATEW